MRAAPTTPKNMHPITENNILPPALKTKRQPSKTHQPSEDDRIADSAPCPAIPALNEVLNKLRNHKMSITSCHAIIKLYMAFSTKKELMNLSALAAQLGVTTAAITSVADSMENLGFAKRVAAPEDRRSTMIRLTTRGLRFAESLGSSGEVHQ
jgi:DNA-binding MarR family transcriptional regulator